ncbi:alpha/beta fold hydrolase [Pedobacter lithocola]|uniref:Alpha/beta fold hydrolase n=1 Tax=Pedobacter lithocola TaxID=1908239 RepID=A0ABV8P6Q8_9SPHI
MDTIKNKLNVDMTMKSSQILINGKSFHVLEKGIGPAVLFCHGFPDTARGWISQMEALANAGYYTIALDMRGFGESYAPVMVSEYSALQIVGDLIGVLDALKIPRAVLVGHDWGADHAQRAVLMRPDRFVGLASLSIPFAPRGKISMWDELRQRGLENLYYAFGMMKEGAEMDFLPSRKSIPSILYWLSASPPEGDRWDPINPARHMLRDADILKPEWADSEYIRYTIRAFEKSGFQGGLNHYRGAQLTFDLMPAFKDAVIRQPSIYIWGEADGLCNFFHPNDPTLEDLSTIHPGIVKVVKLLKVGHFPHLEAPERVSQELIEFLGMIYY